MLAVISFIYDGVDIRKVKEISWIVRSNKYGESDLVLYLSVAWFFVVMSTYLVAVYGEGATVKPDMGTFKVLSASLGIPLVTYIGLVLNAYAG